MHVIFIVELKIKIDNLFIFLFETFLKLQTHILISNIS